jgi:hypothetical protein
VNQQSRSIRSLTPRLSPFLQKPAQTIQIEAVQYAFLWDPTFPCYLDPPSHHVDFGYGMGVGIDGLHAAELQRPLMPTPVKIKPPRVRVDLNGDTVLRASAQYRFDADLISWSSEQLTAGHVTQNRVRVRDRANEAGRLRRYDAALSRHHRVDRHGAPERLAFSPRLRELPLPA